MTDSSKTAAQRRRFLKSAATATVATGALAAPAIAQTPAVTSLRFQSTWPSKDIFHEYALDFAKKANDMTGGELKIEVLPAGSVVPAFGLLDAVSKGTLDGGHGVLGYHYGKQNALALWNSGPMLRHGRQHAAGLAQVRRRSATAARSSTPRSAAMCSPILCGPMTTQPLGWFKKPITKPEDFKGLKFRTNGLAIDLFTAMGAAVNALPAGEIVPALDRGLLDGAEFNNATSDRILGFPDVSKVCMLQSYHQSAETFEISFNKTKYDALPAKMKAIIDNAVEASSCRLSWKAIDRYSKDYIELQTKDKVKFYKTPDSVLQVQLKLWSAILEKKSAENPLFKEIAASQKAFAERVVKWDQDTNVSRRMAVNHFFGGKKA